MEEGTLVKLKFCEKDKNLYAITTLDLSYVVMVMSMVEILKTFVAFSYYVNFNW